MASRAPVRVTGAPYREIPAHQISAWPLQNRLRACAPCSCHVSPIDAEEAAARGLGIYCPIRRGGAGHQQGGNIGDRNGLSLRAKDRAVQNRNRRCRRSIESALQGHAPAHGKILCSSLRRAYSHQLARGGLVRVWAIQARGAADIAMAGIATLGPMRDTAAQLPRMPRRRQKCYVCAKSSPMSAAGALWVKRPTEI